MGNSSNLLEIDQEQALNLSRFFIRSNQNVLFTGRRGIGKSVISMQAAKDCGYKVSYINLSVIERPDISGYPILNDPSDVVNYKSPYFLPLLKDGEKPNQVLLFDEVDKAPHEITAPLLEILQFKTINGKRINAAACILTGNLSNEGAHSNQISSALLDRCAKYVLKFDINHWFEWAKTNNVNDLILGFLLSDPPMACGDVETTQSASPSPRGWTMASDALARAKELNMVDTDTIIAIISGFVGDAAGMKFGMWYKYYREFEPKILSIIENKDYSFELHKLTPSEVYIFCVSLCYLAKRKIIESKSKSKHIFYAENVVKFFDYYKIDYEVQIITLRNSFSFDFITKYKLYESSIFFEKSKFLQEETIYKK